MESAAAGGLAEASAKPCKQLPRLSSLQKQCYDKVQAHLRDNPGCGVGDAIAATGVSVASYYLANKRMVQQAKIAARQGDMHVATDAEAFGTTKLGRPPAQMREGATAHLRNVAEEFGDDMGSELAAVRGIAKLLEPFDLPARARIATAAAVVAKAIRPWREL